MKNLIQEQLDELNSGEYHYLCQSELEDMLDSLEDALVKVKRNLRDIEKYG